MNNTHATDGCSKIFQTTKLKTSTLLGRTIMLVQQLKLALCFCGNSRELNANTETQNAYHRHHDEIENQTQLLVSSTQLIYDHKQAEAIFVL